MSVRALKKRENQQLSAKQFYNNNNNNNSGILTKSTLYKKLNTNLLSQQQQRKYLINSDSTNNQFSRTNLKKRVLLGRYTQSCPELHKVATCFQNYNYNYEHLLRTKSENNISIHKLNSTGTCSAPTPAKSEVCLKTISTHNYQQQVSTNSKSTATATNQSILLKSSNMLTAARSHRDLSQSVGAQNDRSPRRMSESNSISMRSPSLVSATSSGYTINSNNTNATEINSNAVLRVPIIGYEVMEERARFTVYKLRVENPVTNDCWLVLRRYTDFVRLNGKLKQAFPHISLMLPRKKVFGDNFNVVFLDNRVQGLQMFVNSVMARDDLKKSKIVREFFCLDEPPTYSESMEECRAIFEAQEETIGHLKLQVNNKNDLILSLQQKLREEIMEKNQLKEILKNLSKSSLDNSPGSSNNSSTASNST